MLAIKRKNYYQILGVSKTASTEKIRKEYRQLARKYHPDLNQGNKRVEQLFKEVNEAQEVLCNPEKRAKYDRFGQHWQPRSRSKSSSRRNVNFEQYGGFSSTVKDRDKQPEADYSPGNREIFSNFASAFGGGFPNAGSACAEAAITLTFAQAFHGSQQYLKLNGETIEVRIPPGARSGSRISLKGKGKINPYTQQRSDLDLKITLQPHPVFKLQGNNIICQVCITPIEAVLGAEIEVPTADGSAIVKVPPGVNSGQSLRLRNQGWRSFKGERGDQIITLKIVTPKKLTIQEREYYEKLRQISSFRPRRTP